jgi:hypothetical protein
VSVDGWLLDAPSTHTREVPVVCESCGAAFDVALGSGEEFSDLAAEDGPSCCGDEDFGANMIHDARNRALPENFSSRREGDVVWLLRDGKRVRQFFFDLPLLDLVLVYVAEEHRKRFTDERWRR